MSSQQTTSPPSGPTPHWRLEWQHRTLEYHISQIALRYPRNLLRNRATARHQKAVDTTGEIQGYVRWSVPASHATVVTEKGKEEPAWPEAVVPNVSNEEEAEINRVAEKAVWDPSSVTDPLSEGPRVIEEEILSRKGYMGMLKSCVGLAGHPGHAVCYYLGRSDTDENSARLPSRPPPGINDAAWRLLSYAVGCSKLRSDARLSMELAAFIAFIRMS